MLKAVTRQASAVDSKIALLNSRRSSQPQEDVEDGAAANGSKSTSLIKAMQDPNRPEKITPAYFFDHYAVQEDIAVQVTEEDFMIAQQELIPSVSAKELEHYGRVRAMFESAGEKEAREKIAEEEARKMNGGADGLGGQVDRKGKGKAVMNGNASAPVSSMPLRQKMNGTVRRGSSGKGKGKAVTGLDDEDEGYEAGSNGGSGMQFGSAADDEDLY